MNITTGTDSTVVPTYHERDGFTWLELEIKTLYAREGSITLFMSPADAVNFAREIHKVASEKMTGQVTPLGQLEFPADMVIHIPGDR